jgi:hypothetical protein
VTPAPPSPYPLPLRFAGGEEMRGGSALLSPAKREGEGRERAAPRSRRSTLAAMLLRPLAAAGLEYRQTDPVPVCQDVRVPEAQHAKPGSRQVCRAAPVVRHLIGVLASVHLDNQPSLDAEEVQEIGAPWDLPLPFPTAQPMGAQRAPQARFGVCVTAPEFPRARHGGSAPDGSDLAHGGYVNICGTSAQAPTLAPPSPYPLPLRFAGGEAYCEAT